jgi:hypothetical protein
MNDNEIEQEIQDKGLTAPRLTPTSIEDTVKDESYHKLTDVLTVCILTLQNGFVVTGESACASPENYNKETGEKIAKGNAIDKIWVLEGYLLKQKLYDASFKAQLNK